MSAGGRVLWITGLSAAGKSTLAREIQRRLREGGDPAVLVDGDAVRDVIRDPNIGHDRGGRIVNAYRISRLAQLLARQGLTVVVATMSLFHEIHAWNRAHLPGYFEVFIAAAPEVLSRRDPRGLYARAARAAEDNVVGLHLEMEAPLRPDLEITNNGTIEDMPAVAGAILEAFLTAEFQPAGRAARDATA